MTDAPPVSAQVDSWISTGRNGEDVVLRRALARIGTGRLLEFRHPAEPAALQSLVDVGWSGSFASVAELAYPAAAADRIAALGPGDLHVVLVAGDVDPADPGPLLRLAQADPWVLVVGVHPAQDRGPLAAALAEVGYRGTLYDGVSAYFVAAPHEQDLGVSLSYPACARDDYVPRLTAQALQAARLREAQAVESALRWREKAVQSWADASVGGIGSLQDVRQLREHADDLATQLRLLQQTVSWRVTAPLRTVRRFRGGSAR
ncbi:MAG TPA: hypothetical protein PKY70_00805 [Nakamurella multipartita]|mgnify:CR=1 FL=1|nr:hypothetical protein [Nakamurella multipartita]